MYAMNDYEYTMGSTALVVPPITEQDTETAASLVRESYHRFEQIQPKLATALHQQDVALQTSGQQYDEQNNCVEYFRLDDEALLVERMMGRDQIKRSDINADLHPHIEMRLTDEHLAIELVISTRAWVDQQNLAGKLTLPRHRDDFVRQLQGLGHGYYLGYWDGANLEDMHLQSSLFYRIRILNEWLYTFEPGRDTFRLGFWYSPETLLMDEASLIEELTEKFQALYGIYNFIAWRADNNYREFYDDTPRRNAYYY